MIAQPARAAVQLQGRGAQEARCFPGQLARHREEVIHQQRERIPLRLQRGPDGSREAP